MSSVLDAPPALLHGSQQPRICSIPPYGSTAGDEAIDLARMAGIDLDPWQQFVLRESLAESKVWKCAKCTMRGDAKRWRCPEHEQADPLHPWAAFEVGLVVSRQNGKTSLGIARMLAGLFLLGEQLIIYTAHLFDSAMEVFRQLVDVVESTPELLRAVRMNRGRVGTYSHGHEGIELKSGQRVRFKARTSGGGRGFTCDCLLLDEAMILPDAFLGATIPTLSSVPNPQVWHMGSAVDKETNEHGFALTRVRERGKRGDDPHLAYFEWSAEAEDPEIITAKELDDGQLWAQANPALGRRIAAEYIAAERRAMPEREFAVERLGLGDWPAIGDGARVIPAEAWEACADASAAPLDPDGVVFAFDVSPDRARASIAVAGRRGDGLEQVEIVKRGRGAGWVIETLEQLLARHRRATVVCDGTGQGASLLARAEDLRMPVESMNTSEHARACGVFFDAVTGGGVRHLDDPALNAAVAGGVKRPLSDRWAWSRRDSSVDITPLVAATFALGALQDKRGRGPQVIALADLVSEMDDEPAVTLPPLRPQDIEGSQR